MSAHAEGRRPYPDRCAAGQALAAELSGYAGRADVVVLGLPRGGVPVAAEVATRLGAPLDVVLVRKVGLPRHGELAMGAVAAIGDRIEVVRNELVLARAHVGSDAFDEACAREIVELRRRERDYRGDRAGFPVTGRVAILVDDGLATGSTMRAALAALHRQRPGRVVVAVPIGAAESCAALDADEVVCPWQPPQFQAVGQGYLDFAPTSDDEDRTLLAD